MGCLVVRMNLDGQLATGVDELDEQWEHIAEALVILCSDEFIFKLGYQVIKAHTCVLALTDDSFIIFDTGNFPALTYLLQITVKMFEGDYLVTSPNGLL